MSDAESLAAWVRLTRVPGVGGESQRRLLAHFGLPEAIFAAGEQAAAGVIGDKARLLFSTEPTAAIEEALCWASQPGQHIVTLADAAYPPRLLQISDPPVLLYLRGDPALLQTPTLAVVGSRNASAQGLSTATDFARTLASRGLTIVSGLALGVDAAAHRGALNHPGGRTVAVIGTGADRIYPARNQALAREIADLGAIVSEFPLGTPAAAANFPRRNRLISGLALGVLVVEAAPDSGSLITARLAAEQGREVFAIPGSIHSPLSRGCHRLIREGAKLVETAADVLDELAAFSRAPIPPAKPKVTAVETGPVDPILTGLGFDPCDLDTLIERTALPADQLLARLLQLELSGEVAGLPGSRYQRLPR